MERNNKFVLNAGRSVLKKLKEKEIIHSRKEDHMEQEPKNHTIICYFISYTTFPTGKIMHEGERVIYYRNYVSFDYLPLVAQSPVTEQEYNAWWDWYKKYGYSEP